MRSKAVRLRNFRVWIGQVNQTYVDVQAVDSTEAKDKAGRKWRRGYAAAIILDVKEIVPTAHQIDKLNALRFT